MFLRTLTLCILAIDTYGIQLPFTIPGPKSFDDKIAIVGAGASGIHMAVMLKEKGFKNIEILEKENRVGGKSLTIFHRGIPHDLGAVYLSPDYQHNVLPLVEKYVPGDLVVLPPASIWLDDLVEPLRFEHYIISEALKYFKTTDHEEATMKLVATVKKYINLHRKIFHEYEGDLMPEPTQKAKKLIKGTFLEFLERNGVNAISSILYASSTVQGYGRLDEIPALYGLMWNTPKLMLGLLKRLSRKTNETGLFMLRSGFSNLWEKIVANESLNVKLGVTIQRLYRTNDHVFIESRVGSGEVSRKKYDFVIWSPEMKTSLKYWDSKHEEEYYFSKLFPVYFTTALIDTLGEKKGPSSIDYWFDNINKKRQSSLWAQRDSYAALHCYNGPRYQKGQFPSGKDDKPTRTTITYQMSDKEPKETDLDNILKLSLKKINATSIEVLRRKTWRYFPKFSVADTEKGYLWRILEFQGKYGMWYVGSSVSFESLKSVIEYNKLILKNFQLPPNEQS